MPAARAEVIPDDVTSLPPKRRNLWLGVGQDASGKGASAPSERAPGKPARLGRGDAIRIGLLILAVAALYNVVYQSEKVLALAGQLENWFDEYRADVNEWYEKREAWSKLSPAERYRAETAKLIEGGAKDITGPEDLNKDPEKQKVFEKSARLVFRGSMPTLTKEDLATMVRYGGVNNHGSDFDIWQKKDGSILVRTPPGEGPNLKFPTMDTRTGTIVPPVEQAPAPPAETSTSTAQVPDQVYTLSDKDGITQGLEKLRDQLGDKAPQWLKDLNTKEKLAAWAEANGYFKPNEVRDSIVMHRGDVLSIDQSGKLQVRNAAGPVDLKTRGFSDTIR